MAPDRAPAPPPYLLLRQDARRDFWHAVFARGVSLDALHAGLPMDAPGEPARVTVAPAERGASDFLELPCPVVSDVMRAALDAAGVDNVQYFPADLDVQYAEGEVVARYWVANVVGAVSCAEPVTAPAAPAPHGEPPPNFRIDLLRAHGLDLFRLAEDRRLLVVSARVAQALRVAGLRGIVLQAPEEYTGRRVSTAGPDTMGGPDHQRNA